MPIIGPGNRQPIIAVPPQTHKWPRVAHKSAARTPTLLIMGAPCVCETVNGNGASVHRCESLTFSLWRISGAVNGGLVGDATRPHRSGGAWSGTVAVTPRAGRPVGLSGRVCLAPARVRLRECDGNAHALPQSVSASIARRFALGKSSAVTTRELETLAEAVSRLAAGCSRRDRSRRSVWRAWRADLLGRVHGAMKQAGRPYAGKVLVGVAASLLADLERAWRWADEMDELIDAAEGELAAERLQRARLEREQQETAKRMEALEHELAQARADLARRPAATSLVLPAQKITVESGIQREVLRLLAVEGLGRVWRIVERVLDSELTCTPNTARNAVNRLAERDLLADYEQHGKPVTWAYKAGGARRLVQLTPTGRQWCEAAFGQEPVESEIAVAARRHKSVSHGVAVLETAQHLVAAGYQVETEPGAILVAEDEPWRARAEPDLAFTLRGEVWPTEVQREVSPRVVAKWAKSLELCGRLALVLYHEEARRKQQMILFDARYKLPTGRILLCSIEAMEAGGWAWEELTTPR